MAAQWTLVVEGLGKIQHAEVDIRPLTLFVGENNTGKSYLATLLWGLWKFLPWALDKSTSLESYKICTEWIRQHYPNTTKLTHKDATIFINWINEVLEISGPSAIKSYFNNANFQIHNIYIKSPKDFSPLTVQWITASTKTKDRAIVWFKGTNTEPSTFTFSIRADDIQIDSDHLNNIILVISTALAYGESALKVHRETYFLPASRTGFMLLYPTVADYSFERTFGDDGNKSPSPRLPKPAVDFLKLIGNGLTDKRGPFAKEADELESVLRGSLELRSGAGMNQYYYHSEDGHEITMPLASSMVTELAPIILVLRHAPNISMLVLEEPEVHLHPAVQRKLAVVIARLIRRGVKIVITTHGDLFCHQLNNLIKLGAHPRRAEMQSKLGYADHEYLLPEEVSGYDFHHVGAHTELSRLEMTEFGLVMPTFNNELSKLVQESRALEATPEESP